MSQMDSDKPTTARIVGPSLRVWLALGAGTAALVALPFLATSIPPISDLAQNVAQVRLLIEALGNPSSPYTIHWLTPHILVYLLMVPLWKLLSPWHVGPATMVMLGLLWVGALFVLTRRRGRPPGAAILASLFFFGISTYWGFLTFLLGLPIFLGWVELTTRVEGRREPSPTSFVFLLIGAALLYLTHILWFGVGLLWLGVDTLLFRRDWTRAITRLIAILPPLLLVAFWYPRLSHSGFTSRTAWSTLPTGRLSFSWWGNSALGGLGGWMDYLVVGVVCVWCAAGLWSHRQRLREHVDIELLTASALLFALTVFLPNYMQNTIVFAGRWAAGAMILLLLSLPSPDLKPSLRWGGALALALGLSMTTAARWKALEVNELSGLHDAVSALPDNPRVIGLSFRKRSAIISGSSIYPWNPFLQMFAYAQVVHGGRLNFSFAEFGSMPVVFRDLGRGHKWTYGLEWEPGKVRRSDFLNFDYALVNGSKDVQQRAAKIPVLEQVTKRGSWRLYRVRK